MHPWFDTQDLGVCPLFSRILAWGKYFGLLATGGSPAFHEGGGPCAFIARRFLRDLITQLGRVVVAVVVGRMVLHNLPQCFGGLPASI